MNNWEIFIKIKIFNYEHEDLVYSLIIIKTMVSPSFN